MLHLRPLVSACLAFILLVAPATAATLTIGTIDDEPKKTTKRFEARAAYLEPRLAGKSVEAVEVSIALRTADVVADLRDGAVDIYLDSPLIMALVMRETGARPFLRRWKDNVAEYQSVLVARGDSGITRLDELRGRVIASEEDSSTSGYLLPKAMLVEQGYRLVEVADTGASVPADAIGYVFSDDDDNTVAWVRKGVVAAGAVNSINHEKIEAKRPGTTKVLARSQALARHVVSHRAGLDPALVQAVADALLAMEGDEEGREVLKTFKTARFDRFPESVDEVFARVEAILARLPELRAN